MERLSDLVELGGPDTEEFLKIFVKIHNDFRIQFAEIELARNALFGHDLTDTLCDGEGNLCCL